MKKVRTRIAPSPTGDPHVGTAYIALFNYCFAKSHNGEFILRIEDTDQVRSTLDSELNIFESLKWLGIEWTEGPDKGGNHAPYRQSERKSIYQAYAQELIDNGHAFYCFATPEELTIMRDQQIERNEDVRYDGRGLLLTQKEIETNLASGMPYVIRMKIPDNGVCIIPDMLRGDVAIAWSLMDMQVLIKTDGLPTYFLANVVDDHLMEISHVIRGDEWLASAPKLILLYQYFGWELPQFCHMPLLRNPDSSKLSKRKNPTSITYYKDKGFLPEAMLNYLGRMGWSMPDGKEKFTLQEMIDNFDIHRVSLGGPIFDVEKLSWLNGQWIRSLSLDVFSEYLKEYNLSQEHLLMLAPMVQIRVELIGQIKPLIEFLFTATLTYSKDLFIHKTKSAHEIKDFLNLSMTQLDNLDVWNKESILSAIKVGAEQCDFKLKEGMPSIFVSITGSLNSISVIEAMVILGKDKTQQRLKQAFETI